MTYIIINRATAQQALEALKYLRDTAICSADIDSANEVIPDLEAALAQQAEPDTCTWQQDGDSDSGVYGTSCGHYFQIGDGTPDDNKMAWCCYCGKKLAQELITENKDD